MLRLMSAVETGQMSAAETRHLPPPPSSPAAPRGLAPPRCCWGGWGWGQVSCLNSRHLSCLNSRHQHQHSSLSISIQNQQSSYHGGCDSSRLHSERPARYITLSSRVMISKGYISGMTVNPALANWDHRHHGFTGAQDIPTLIVARSRLL